MIDARFNHVNVIARDWRSLADFYTRVFGCEFVPPERDYSGPVFAAGVGVPGGALRGVHLRLPGAGEGGPAAGGSVSVCMISASATSVLLPTWTMALVLPASDRATSMRCSSTSRLAAFG